MLQERKGVLFGQSCSSVHQSRSAEPPTFLLLDSGDAPSGLNVLQPIIDRLGGRSALLTLHFQSDAPPAPLAVFSDTEQCKIDQAAHLSVGRMVCAETLRGPALPVGPGILVREPDSGLRFLVLRSISRRARSQAVLSVALEGSDTDQMHLMQTELDWIWPLVDDYLRLFQRDRLHLRHLRSLEAALDRLDLGVVIVARNGEMSYSNDAASDMFLEGKVIRRRGQQIVGANAASSMMLQSSLSLAVAANEDALDGMYDEAKAGTLFKLGDSEKMLICVAFPLGLPAAEPLDRAAVLLLLDPSREPDRLVEPICKLYGLSAVETRLACQLVRGRSLSEACKTLRIKEQTARSYLKQIFAKLNVHRQADLVRLLLANVVRSRMSVAAVPALTRTGLLVV